MTSCAFVQLRLITTLSYLVSYIFAIPWHISGLVQIDTTFLRFTNQIGAILLAWVVFQILQTLNGNFDHEKVGLPKQKDAGVIWSSVELVHVGINICLFPPLFFFYGLYYTDVLSALSVLLVYKYHLQRKHAAMIIAAGILSLLFRQTNVLWVSVFLGGLALCRAVPKWQSDAELFDGVELYGIAQDSWQHALAYDPPINEASFEGCLALLRWS